MKIRFKDLKAKASERPQGYVEAVIAKGKLIDDGNTIELTPEAYADLVKQYDPASIGKPVKGVCPSCSRSVASIRPVPQSKANKQGPQFPPVATQINNAGKAVAKVVGNIVKGINPIVSKAEQDARLAICNVCPQFKDGRCLKCGCVAKLKTRLTSQHCPIGSW